MNNIFILKKITGFEVKRHQQYWKNIYPLTIFLHGFLGHGQ